MRPWSPYVPRTIHVGHPYEVCFIQHLRRAYSLDSLIRLDTDNLNLSSKRLGKPVYVIGNAFVLFGLTVAFKSQWLQIQWIGAVVIGLYVACLTYIVMFKRAEVMAIDASPEENTLDFGRIEGVH